MINISKIKMLRSLIKSPIINNNHSTIIAGACIQLIIAKGAPFVRLPPSPGGANGVPRELEDNMLSTHLGLPEFRPALG